MGATIHCDEDDRLLLLETGWQRCLKGGNLAASRMDSDQILATGPVASNYCRLGLCEDIF